MKQPKFKGFSRETNQWHYGFGWFNADLTEKYLKEKGIPQQATLFTESGKIYCDLDSMAQLIGKDSKGQEVYTNDILQTSNSGGEYTVVLFQNATLFKRYHFVDEYDGEQFDDKNDSPLYLSSHKVVGTVYEIGIPFHKRIGKTFKYEVEYRK